MKSILLILAMVLSFQSFGKVHKIDNKGEIDPYWSIAEVTITPVKNVAPAFEVADEKGLGEIIMVVDQLIALGKKIYQIINDGRPVVNTNFRDPLSVLPRVEGTDSDIAFYEMENWSAPKEKSFKVAFKNFFGMEVISFVYSISFQHSGSYQGTGKYLTGVVLTASKVSVDWGFEFNASTRVISIANIGSKANPLASTTLALEYRAKGLFNDISMTHKYFLQGDGKVSQID